NVVPLADEDLPASRTVLRRELVHVPDTFADEWAGTSLRETAERRGFRAIMHAPMLRGADAIGSIAVCRTTPGPFSDKQVGLLRTCADQAVIAMETARLFKELQARNAELTEPLNQQPATAEILKVMSGSPPHPQPVFDAIVNSCSRLFGSMTSSLRLIVGDYAE